MAVRGGEEDELLPLVAGGLGGGEEGVAGDEEGALVRSGATRLGDAASVGASEAEEGG